MMDFYLELGCGASGEKFLRVHVAQIMASSLDDAIWKAQNVIASVSEFISPTLVLLFNGSAMLVWSQVRYRADTGDGLNRRRIPVTLGECKMYRQRVAGSQILIQQFRKIPFFIKDSPLSPDPRILLE
ncbi:MAG: hypothetical protein JWM36_143 [Hyphomicrobiales bacterium]|nr:hypothetical protein [Hyphomicrobiales bacterium]